MDRPVSPAMRWARAGLLAALAMGSGVLAHVSARGLVPGVAPMALLFALCWAGAATFLAREASTLRIVTLVVVGQTFIHGVLTAMVGHRGDPPLARVPVPVTPPPAPMPMPGLDGHRLGSLADLTQAGRPPAVAPQPTIPAPLQHLMADFTGPHALMAVAHLVAAVALGCWLARGERLLWSVLTLTATRLADLVVGVRTLARAATDLLPHAGARPRRRTPLAWSVGRGRTLASEVGLRGPPVAGLG